MERKVGPCAKCVQPRYSTSGYCYAHFLAHRREYRKRTNSKYDKERRASIAKYIQTAKQVPCKDCNRVYHYCAMDFDHIGEKSFNIGGSGASHRYSIKRIQAEIAKCDVVCSNCHRVRTFNRTESRDEWKRLAATS